jgi:hypothetical protein
MRFIALVLITVGAVMGLTTLLGGSALAAQQGNDVTIHQSLLASTTPSPTPHASASPTATTHASSSPTAAAVPKSGGPPSASGGSSLAYLLVALGALGLASAGLVAIRLRRTV